MTQLNLKKTARSVAIATLVLTVLASTAVTANACEFIDNLMPWNWCKSNEYAATTYAPPFTPVAAPATACCPAPTSYMTARYIPQTCYRTVYRTMPMTSCQAVNSCDPCTGCPVTTLRPVTAYRRVAQLVPYTTYRIAWQNNLCYTSCYSPCATGCYSGCSSCDTGCSSCVSGCSSCTSGCYSGACGTDVTSSGCSSCASGTTTTITPQPEAQPTYSNGSQQPTLSPNGGASWNTRRPTESQGVKPSPQPDPTTRQDYQSKPFQIPQLVPAGRTASAPVRLVSYNAPQQVSRSMDVSNAVEDTNEWQAR